MKPFFASGADVRKQRFVTKPPTTAEMPVLSAETVRMRTISFILAFGFVLGGPSMAGVSDSGLAGVGTFSYSGSPIVPAAPRTIMVAAN